MRIRVLAVWAVFVPTVLGIGAGAAPAATLFSTTAHTAEVPVGTTVTATAETNVDFTLSSQPGLVWGRCTAADLHATVARNAGGVVALRVTGGAFAPCDQLTYQPTFATPWTLTVTGNGTVSGTNTAYSATVDSVAYDVVGAGSFQGNLENVTVTQPTTATSPITLRMNGGCGLLNATLGGLCVHGSFRLDGTAAGWSLTN
jgi:hypothetical protein